MRMFVLMQALVFSVVLAPPALAADAAALAAQIGAISGLTATANADEVFVVGNAAISTNANRIFLNIDPDVTVHWQANLSSSLATTNYALNLNGSGTLEISSCTISNATGTSGAIDITGTGTTVVVGNDAEVLSNRDTSSAAGNAIHINADDVTLTVLAGGTVTSGSGNSAAAIQVADGRANVAINVDGGTVLSEASGYAISDDLSAGHGNNNTAITIDNGGTVQVGTSTAIRSSGAGSVVEVRNGTVSSSGTTAVTPTINMSGSNVDDVIVNGGTVKNTGTSAGSTSYAIQTSGNVIVNDGEVSTATGRAINLVGLDSTATVNGGIVRATTSGVAISTATTTTANVANASVVVTGGEVSAPSGPAIRVTGANSKVTVTGGVVSVASGNAIHAERVTGAGNADSALNAQIIVSGGSVMSITGTAIQADGINSIVTVSDTINGSGGAGGRGGQVSVLAAKPAINSAGTVTVNGGLVFAFGTNALDAVAAALFNAPVSGGGGMVGVWDQAAGETVYTHGSSDHLTPIVGGPPDFYWALNSSFESGIAYYNGATAGFFPLNLVTVVRNPTPTPTMAIPVLNPAILVLLTLALAGLASGIRNRL